jgi:uncharacterized protein
MKRTLSFLFALCPLLAFTTVDPCLPQKPAGEDHLVFQFTDFLSDFDKGRLDAKLMHFAQETSNRIAVVVVDDLCGYEASDFAFDLGESWGIGAKGKDNGILVLVKPTGKPGERKVFIATGYGMEGAVPDLLNKRIVEERIIPHFKNGEFYEGLDEATDGLMALAKNEFNEESLGQKSSPTAPLFMVAVFLIIIVLAFVAQRNKVRQYARTNGIDFWSALWLLSQATRSHRGTWGGFTGGGGGWSGGGGGGGGFGGFGGGSFGGGGAGGSW